MKKCIYLAEGECEEKLLNALKEKPSLVIPGKVKKFNVIQDVIPRSMLMQFDPGILVVLVFDTDKETTEYLKKNIEMLKNLSFKVRTATVVQVLNFEHEIERSTDVKRAIDLTKSRSLDDFKAQVNKMKANEFRNALRRHKFDVTKLWEQDPPAAFDFVKQESEKIKI